MAKGRAIVAETDCVGHDGDSRIWPMSEGGNGS